MYPSLITYKSGTVGTIYIKKRERPVGVAPAIIMVK